MKKTISIALVCLCAIVFLSNIKQNEKTSYKCLIQLKNYEGEGAYIIASVIDKKGNYVKTLQVFGDDPQWYHDLHQWWEHYKNEKYDIEAITGATISAGERQVKIISIDHKFLNQGYSIKFESAVEEQRYYSDDVNIELISENLNGKKIEGNGYIRYVRIIAQK